MSIKSEEERKCQESIQLVSHLTQNILWESDKRTRKRHIQERLEGQPRLRPSPCIPNGPTEETIECRRHERVESTRGVSFHPIVRAPPTPRDFVLIFSASMFIFNGFGPRLQSIWIRSCFFFLLEWSEKPNAGHNPSS